MRWSFWRAASFSAAIYAAALLAAFTLDFRIALFALLAIQATWTLWCIVRVVQLRAADDREAYWFALGGSSSSLVLLLAVIVWTQVV